MNSKGFIKFIALLVIVIILGIILVWAFKARKSEIASETVKDAPVKSEGSVTTKDGETIISLDTESQSKAGLVVIPIKAINHTDEIQGYGTVLSVQDLVDFKNNWLLGKNQLEKAQTAMALSRKEYERIKILHDDNRNASDKMLQEAESAWKSDKLNVQSAEITLQNLQSSLRQQWGETIAKWPMNSLEQIERLISQKEVLVQVSVPPDSPLTTPPGSARIQLSAGKFSSIKYIAPSLRADSKFQGKSWIYLANAGPTGLIPGLNVTVFLPGNQKLNGFYIPNASVVWKNGDPWVYLQKDDEHYTSRQISLDIPMEDGWFVPSGFSKEDKLVTTGAQSLLSEEFKSQIQADE